MKKRILSMILATAMVITLLPLSVLGAYDTDLDDFPFGGQVENPGIGLVGPYAYDEDENIMLAEDELFRYKRESFAYGDTIYYLIYDETVIITDEDENELHGSALSNKMNEYTEELDIDEEWVENGHLVDNVTIVPVRVSPFRMIPSSDDEEEQSYSSMGSLLLESPLGREMTKPYDDFDDEQRQDALDGISVLLYFVKIDTNKNSSAERSLVSGIFEFDRKADSKNGVKKVKDDRREVEFELAQQRYYADAEELVVTDQADLDLGDTYGLKFDSDDEVELNIGEEATVTFDASGQGKIVLKVDTEPVEGISCGSTEGGQDPNLPPSFYNLPSTTYFLNFTNGIGQPVRLNRQATVELHKFDGAQHVYRVGNGAMEEIELEDDGSDDLIFKTVTLDQYAITQFPIRYHVFGDWLYNGTDHWKQCGDCGNISGKAAHTIKDGACTVCGWQDGWQYFSFGNSKSSFFTGTEQINGKTNYSVGGYDADLRDVIATYYAGSEYDSLVDYVMVEKQQRNWGGSCYGMALSNMLYNLGGMSINNYDPDNSTLPPVIAPAQNKNGSLRDMINYYHLMQYIPEISGTVYNVKSGYKNYQAGRQQLLKLAKDIAENGKKALFGYYYTTSSGDSGGHAIVVDGGVKNPDGGYTLNGYDNRYYGYTWHSDAGEQLAGKPFTLDVRIAADGTFTVGRNAPSRLMTSDGRSGTLSAFTETGYAFDCIMADSAIMDELMLLAPGVVEPEPEPEPQLSEEEIRLKLTKQFLRLLVEPKNHNAAENMTVTGPNGLLVSAAPSSNNSGVSSIRLLTSATGGELVNGVITYPEPSPVGVMAELGSLSGSYAVSSPNGSVALLAGDRLLSLTTDGAQSAVIDNDGNAVSITGNSGDFSISLTTADGRLAVVSGAANGDVEVSREGDGVTVRTLGSYVVEYISDGQRPQALVQQDAQRAAQQPSAAPSNPATGAE